LLFSEENLTAEESRPLKLAEYAAIRSEITTHLTIQVQFMNYSVILGGGLAGLFINHPSFEAAAFFPLPFLILGLLYGDTKARILRAASYIQNDLRSTLIDSADEPVLMWEFFIRRESTLNPFLSGAEKLRWAVFFVPLAVPITWLVWNRPHPQHGLLGGVLFAVELVMLFLLIWVAFKLDSYSKRLLDEKQK
jgi:hypothetical protein